jgi:hypothetical protein
MDLIDRYVYAVTRNLPPKKRLEIEKDLRRQIDEELNRKTGGQSARPEDIEAVLLGMGDPAKVADQYRGHPRYLIGPVHFDTYWLVLRIVLLAATLGIVVSTVARLIVNPAELAGQIMIDFLSGLYSALIGAFGAVTLIFALIESISPQTGLSPEKKETWQIRDLPKIPASSLAIKKSDPIAAIIFTLIFLVIINVNVSVIGAYIRDGLGQLAIVPLFSQRFAEFLPWIDLSLVLALVLEFIKLAVGRWNILLIAGSVIQKVFGLAVGVSFFASAEIFNSAFFATMEDIFHTSNQSIITTVPTTICRVATILIIAGFVIDMITLIVKTVKLAMGMRK